MVVRPVPMTLSCLKPMRSSKTMPVDSPGKIGGILACAGTSVGRALPFRAILILTLMLFIFTGFASARNGIYRVALIRVSYPDTSAGPYSVPQINTAAGEVRSYFRALSYGNLDLQLVVTEARYSHGNAFYFAPCLAVGETRSPCPPDRVSEAVELAALSGIDFSGINGVLLLQPSCGRGITSGAQTTFSTPHVHRTVTTSDIYSCPVDPANAPGASGIDWGSWAHEVGHQLEVADGVRFDAPWLGHPSGYGSAYDLMDSCYPCGASAFSLLGPPLNNSPRTVFAGWLPATKVVTVERPAHPSGVTVVLAPLSQDPTSTEAPQAIKVPIVPGMYYMVEARRRSGVDALDHGRGTGGIFDEGIRIQKIEESHNWPANNIESCDFLVAGGCVHSSSDPRAGDCSTVRPGMPAYCWPYPLWHPGQAFTDGDNGIQIRVDAQIGNGYAVTINRGNASGHPDLFITPWLTPPMNTWETADIWVDSSCNGYESVVGAAGLRYGRRPDGTVIGNGDDPCIGHTNRVYAHIRNLGDAPANNVRVIFRATDPPGVGIPDAHGWIEIGAVTAAQFPLLASLPAGASTDVYITWVPHHTLTPAEVEARRFAFHTGLQVEIATDTSEIVTGNQLATENFEYFEARQDPPLDTWDTILGEFFLRNDSGNDGLKRPRTYYLDVRSELPQGWSYVVGDGQMAITLDTGEVRAIPVVIKPSKDAQPGESYTLKVEASTDLAPSNTAAPSAKLDESVRSPIAGVVMSAHTVKTTRLSISPYLDAQQNLAITGIVKSGSGFVTLDYVTLDGSVISHLAPIGGQGDFKDAFGPLGKGVTLVRAIYQGDAQNSSAVAETKVPAAK